MNIVVFTPSFSLKTETFVYDLCCELVRGGSSVTILTFARLNEAERPFDGVKILKRPSILNPRRVRLRVRRLFLGESAAETTPILYERRVRKALQELNPDVVIASFGTSGVLACRATAELGIPLVTWFHGYDASRLLQERGWRRAYKRFLEGHVTQVVPSLYLKKRLVESGANAASIEVIHYGVRRSVPKVGGVTPTEPVTVDFIFVGRLVPKKAPLLLMHSFRFAERLLAPTRVARLTVIGDGPLRAQFLRRVEETGDPGSVRYLGQMNHEATLETLAESDVYVQHSVTASNGDTEGLPVAITEAAAIGLPIVSTEHAGIPEAVIHGETGYLVDENDWETMGYYMWKLGEDETLRKRFGGAGQDHIWTYFDMSRVVQQWYDLLERATGEYKDEVGIQ